MASHLLILGDREALSWVLRTERMAFSLRRARLVAAVIPGDTLFLYTTRGCFHNPGRDRGRVIGKATVTSPVEELQPSIVVMGREFQLGCTFDLVALAPWREGVDFAELVPQLTVFPNKRAWSTLMRRPLLTLPPADARLIEKQLAPLGAAPPTTISRYV